MNKKPYVVKKVFNEHELEDTLNDTVAEGYEVQQIFLRSWFSQASKHRGLYYAIIFKLIKEET